MPLSTQARVLPILTAHHGFQEAEGLTLTQQVVLQQWQNFLVGKYFPNTAYRGKKKKQLKYMHFTAKLLIAVQRC